MRKIFEQWGKCCLRLKRSAFNLFGWGKSYSRLKRSAFTLAEVLIVLAIIGVVAAMTIPTLMNKIQDMRYKTAYKKAYSVTSQAWTKAVNDDLIVERPSWTDGASRVTNLEGFMS